MILHHEAIATGVTGLGLSAWVWGALAVNAAIYYARMGLLRLKYRLRSYRGVDRKSRSL